MDHCCRLHRPIFASPSPIRTNPSASTNSFPMSSHRRLYTPDYPTKRLVGQTTSSSPCPTPLSTLALCGSGNFSNLCSNYPLQRAGGRLSRRPRLVEWIGALDPGHKGLHEGMNNKQVCHWSIEDTLDPISPHVHTNPSSNPRSPPVQPTPSRDPAPELCPLNRTTAQKPYTPIPRPTLHGS